MTPWADTVQPCGCTESRSGSAVVALTCAAHFVPYVSPRREARRRHRQRREAFHQPDSDQMPVPDDDTPEID